MELFRFEHVAVDGPAGSRLRDIDGAVPEGGVTVIVGPSGAGKSTLLRCCNRLVVPTAGRVWFRDQDVAELSPLRLRRRVGMVFQRPTPFGGTVRDNLHVAVPGLPDPAAGAVLERVVLTPDFLDRSATELSAGEAQRVCLARTLAADPEVLLMDEPTASLDARAGRMLEELARAMAARGVPVLWVTHDLAQMRRLADHVLVVMGGRLAAAGPPTAVANVGGAAARFLAGGDG